MDSYIGQTVKYNSIFYDALTEKKFFEPTLLISPKLVVDKYHDLLSGLDDAEIFYAVKANPHISIIKALNEVGSSFDVASMGEINICLDAGVPPDKMSFGNVVKTQRDIRAAYELGINIFAVDAIDELKKIHQNAPNADVFVRILVSESEAEWPLSDKSGCSSAMGLDLIRQGLDMGLNMIGLSFHVGSQTRRPEMWAKTLDNISTIWESAIERGYSLSFLNIGGGFPAKYGRESIDTQEYCQNLMRMIRNRFSNVTRIIAEPGRGLVAEAGIIIAEVILVSHKEYSDKHRWVYLNIGLFSGLAETLGEAIRYKFISDHDDTPKGPCIIAGPSCDSADILYRYNMVDLPECLKSGDSILIEDTGAYTSTYASVGFNGFPPLKVQVI